MTWSLSREIKIGQVVDSRFEITALIYSSAVMMKVDLNFPENVQVTGKYRNSQDVNAWPKGLRLAGLILSIAATPFILFYLFFLMFQRELAL